MAQGVLGTPAVARLVKVQVNLAAGEINNVQGSRAVHVSEAYPPAIEQIGAVKLWGPVHGDLRPKVAIPEVRPVAHLPISDANQIGQTITRHVGQENRLCAVSEDQLGSFFFIESSRHALRGSEPLRGERDIPGEDVIFGNKQIREAVASKINEFEIWVSPIDSWKRIEDLEGFPVCVFCPLEKSRRGAVELH